MEGKANGEKIRRLRFEKNVSNDDIANAIGVSPGAVSRMITEDKPLSLKKMAKLAELFEVPLDDLVR